MATSKYINQYPESPDDVKVVDIPTISLARLQEETTTESEALYKACRELGFFLLELQASEEGNALLEDAEKMFGITHETLNLGKEELERFAYNPPRSLLGHV